jgi:predicted RNase H-like nuclease (RuvC/YqgF family)
MAKRTSDERDNDHTDELPVLLESAVLEEESLPAAGHPEDTGEHTALYRAAEHVGSAETHTALTESSGRVAELETQVAALTDRDRDRRHLLAEKEALVADLQRTIAAARQSAQDANAAERRLATQLAVRDARVAELTAAIEKLQETANAEQVEIAGLRSTAEAARQEAAALKRELADKPAQGPAATELQELLEANATLRDYIAGRRAWWDEMLASQTSLQSKIGALDDALATAAKRALEAEAFAARESSRAISLRAELVESARRVMALERELRSREGQTVAAPPASASHSAPAISVDAPAVPAAPPEGVPAGDVVGRDAREVDERVPTLDSAGAAPGVEALAQLEGEVEYKRHQVAAQLVELHDRDQRLLAASSELERLRRDSYALRNELDEARSTISRLERAVIDKDRALDARDTRIATLQEELKQRLGVIEKLHAIDFSLAKLEGGAAPRASAVEAGADSTAPALLCLTGDAPKRFALTRKTNTVGRGPQCDLQILTHFVSREHARITVNDGTVSIEDLGSRNGVFVNSARVERQVLQQGDLVTIGETQFRFMESMAH